MQNRRLGGGLMLTCVAALLMLGAASPARSKSVRDVKVQGADGPIWARLLAGAADGKRPAVIILHGRESLEKLPSPYTHYAEALAARGIDAWLVSHYDSADAQAMSSPDRAARVKYFGDHLKSWSNRIHDVVGHILQREDASGKVGLLGFSNGGFLAVMSAANDPRVTALVVFYGGISGPKAEIAQLPPLLALHGEADRVIAIAAGTALVARARALGGQAELVTYPGRTCVRFRSVESRRQRCIGPRAVVSANANEVTGQGGSAFTPSLDWFA